MAKVTEGTSGSDGVIIIADSTTEPVLEVRLATDAHNRLEILGDGTIRTGDGGSSRLASSASYLGHAIDGQETFPRIFAQGACTLSTGNLRVAYFTAERTRVTTQVRAFVATTGAAATPTLARIGVYSVADNGDLTLVASTANDTSLFATIGAGYTRALTSSLTLVQGQRYAAGPLVVTGVTAPNVMGIGLGSGSSVALADTPRMNGQVSGQTDLPASVPAASVVATGSMPWVVLLP